METWNYISARIKTCCETRETAIKRKWIEMSGNFAFQKSLTALLLITAWGGKKSELETGQLTFNKSSNKGAKLTAMDRRETVNVCVRFRNNRTLHNYLRPPLTWCWVLFTLSTIYVRTKNPILAIQRLRHLATRDYVSLSVFVFLFCRDFFLRCTWFTKETLATFPVSRLCLFSKKMPVMEISRRAIWLYGAQVKDVEHFWNLIKLLPLFSFDRLFQAAQHELRDRRKVAQSPVAVLAAVTIIIFRMCLRINYHKAYVTSPKTCFICTRWSSFVFFFLKLR